ncbi:MAG: DNA starvation/stationary phase protection protein [Bacteroidales bacterium]|nr:DNA starvation/stationary phase protection protein [Bacteroidales bacterium]
MKTLDYLHLDDTKLTKVLDSLHKLLANYQVHYTNLRGLHWNIKGRGFFTLHEKFETMYNDTAEKVDEIAERILMLGGVPENRFSEYLKQSCVKEVGEVSCGHHAVEIVLDTYKILIEKERKLIDIATEVGDVVTADMLTGYLKEQEKMVWMLVAFCTHHCEK